LNLDDYEIMDPNLNYGGKSYSALASDWFNYFLSIDADKRTLGPVVFLKSVPAPKLNSEGSTNVASESTSSSASAADAYYPRRYENNPNVRVGGDKLQIFTDQAVFWPILTAYEMASKPYQDWGELQEYTGSIMDSGDDPPDEDQITINGKPIKLPKNLEMLKFRILTPVFPTIVPDVGYGRSLRDFLEDEVPPGHYPTVVEGYFLLIKFNNPKTYLLHSLAKAGREVRGPYTAEILCEIQVNLGPRKLPTKGRPIGVRVARNDGIIGRVLAEKINNNELSETQANNILNLAGKDQIFNTKKKA
jgi:hypothetical protein